MSVPKRVKEIDYGAFVNVAVDTKTADSLLRKRSVDSVLAAADAYEAAAAAADVASAAALRLKAADALCTAMRIRGHGNILVLDDTSGAIATLDTPENKKFWGKHGPRALSLVRAAREARAPLRAGALAAVTEMEAFMYAAASKGILQQALTGAGSTYLKLANELASKHPQHDDSCGNGFLGGFYGVAPWPLGDKKRALREFETAFKSAPTSRMNGYHACLLRLQLGDAAGAVKVCESALRSARCDHAPKPRDFCSFLTDQTERVLASAKARTAAVTGVRESRDA